VRQQEAHFKKGQWIFIREMQFVPKLLSRWHIEKLRLEFIPAVGGSSAFGSHASCQYIQEVEGAGYGTIRRGYRWLRFASCG
jgi:coenzyme F420-reducing hydrogenase delta subunit